MMQVVPMSHEEKVKMYMRVLKKKLIEMLIECNRLLDKPPTVYIGGIDPIDGSKSVFCSGVAHMNGKGEMIFEQIK